MPSTYRPYSRATEAVTGHIEVVGLGWKRTFEPEPPPPGRPHHVAGEKSSPQRLVLCQ